MAAPITPTRLHNLKMQAQGLVEGVLQLKGRVGFILSENPKVSDVLVEDASLRLAMDGDRVRATIIAGREATRRYGRITEVLTRAKATPWSARSRW